MTVRSTPIQCTVTETQFFPAEIRDPIFEQTPNPYISAMNSSEEIEVNVVKSYKQGELYKIYIMGLAQKAA